MDQLWIASIGPVIAYVLILLGLLIRSKTSVWKKIIVKVEKIFQKEISAWHAKRGVKSLSWFLHRHREEKDQLENYSKEEDVSNNAGDMIMNGVNERLNHFEGPLWK